MKAPESGSKSAEIPKPTIPAVFTATYKLRTRLSNNFLGAHESLMSCLIKFLNIPVHRSDAHRRPGRTSIITSTIVVARKHNVTIMSTATMTIIAL